MADAIVHGHGVCFIFIGIVFLILHFSHLKERKDLYNRIMSRDIGDYIANTEKVIVKPKKDIIRL